MQSAVCTIPLHFVCTCYFISRDILYLEGFAPCHRPPLQSVIGDWEDGWTGDSKDRGECRIRVVDITLPKLLPVELDSLVAAASRLFEHVASGIVSAPLDVRSFLLKKEQDE